jgi:hypothetical protein
MFSLKEPSLLAFDQRRDDMSLKNLYKIKSIPSDTQHRAILDEVSPEELNPCFADIFYELQRGGKLKGFVFQDGNNKNDCERNAVRRLLQQVRRMHPKLDCIVIEDGLSSNGPHIEDLIALNFKFILGAKPNDHTYLFDNFMKPIKRLPSDSVGLRS